MDIYCIYISHNRDIIDLPRGTSDRNVICALRTIHQNQPQLIVLADPKANILVGIVANDFAAKRLLIQDIYQIDIVLRKNILY